MTGRTVRRWAGLSQVHVLLDGHRIKTLPSRPGARDLARLTASGAQPAGPPPLPPAAGDVTEADRTVNASGNVSLGDHVISAGLPLAGQRITLHLDGPAHARKTVQVTVGPGTDQVAAGTGITVTAARTASRDIRRHKASNYSRPPAAPADLCPAGTFSATLANVDDLDLLRHEFNAEDGSFLVQLRVDYHWLRCYHASTKRPSRVQRSHDDTGEHDHMADTILTESEASLAVEDLGWRYLLDCLTTAVRVDSLFDACEVIRAAVESACLHANDHLRLRATADRVEFTLETRGKFRVTTQDVDLARSITKAVRTAGYQTVAHPAHHSVQSLAIAIDAMDIPAVRPFWKAVLGYDHVPAPADLVDPSAGGPSLWFQQMDEPRTQRNRIHLDLTVPHDDAVARVEAALAAGGRLVSDDHARAFWILADSEGNEVCVCTWQDRD